VITKPRSLRTRSVFPILSHAVEHERIDGCPFGAGEYYLNSSEPATGPPLMKFACDGGLSTETGIVDAGRLIGNEEPLPQNEGVIVPFG
jgi:hypothetical protein